ncbi:uncharacterized protein LOC132745268 isoform X2 [Ruditapes philippinarum]|uniref:uncharacterized protein LOC132745268 isoform X2 n=1 Tax=Ruditapes philippinarum TaxID=129788 RepID=UPI00295AB3D6|nr:uncharacterized protein LOC132745268 isoform X2 [Ruditapes philippinarum]
MYLFCLIKDLFTQQQQQQQQQQQYNTERHSQQQQYQQQFPQQTPYQNQQTWTYVGQQQQQANPQLIAIPLNPEALATGEIDKSRQAAIMPPPAKRPYVWDDDADFQ